MISKASRSRSQLQVPLGISRRVVEPIAANDRARVHVLRSAKTYTSSVTRVRNLGTLAENDSGIHSVPIVFRDEHPISQQGKAHPVLPLPAPDHHEVSGDESSEAVDDG